eukprot:TRINITY_DN2951_c0_g1_i1.p2 TRINITY_DN2951_c0_g1~~TRINITY_DN2951_c0_g1_i1.p2  ORF type:complete len:139 (-),score=14.39 TRINITY_DN2951_c0_g1_i1:31-447(-)
MYSPKHKIHKLSYNKTCWCRRCLGNQRLETEVFCGDAILLELRFVHPNHVIVGLRELSQLILQVLDGRVLGVNEIIQLSADGAKNGWIEVGGSQNLGELGFFLLECLLQRLHFLFQKNVFETRLLLDLMDGRLELLTE